MKNLRTFFEQWLQSCSDEELKAIITLRLHWPEIVGDKLDQISTPSALTQDKLIVDVLGKASAQAFMNVRDVVIQKIRQIAPHIAVNEIECRIVYTDMKTPEKYVHSQSVVHEQEHLPRHFLEEAQKLVAHLDDPLLKRHFIRAYAKWMLQKEEKTS